MEDINKKLQSKMLLFNKITNETNQSDQPLFNLNNKKRNIFLIPSSNHSNKENHDHDDDQPYAYFNVKQLQLNSNMISYDVSSSTKYDSKPQKSHKNRQQHSRLSTVTNNNSKVKNTQLMNKDVSSRLYNYGFYIKNKHFEKRKEEDRKRQQRMSPNILPRSRSISRDSMERLNKDKSIKSPSSFVKQNNNIYPNKKPIKAFNGYGHCIKPKSHINRNKSCNNLNYSFKPQLNNNSLRIATNLEPSIYRLTNKSKSKSRSKSKSKSKPSNSSLIKLSYDYQKINKAAMLPSFPNHQTPSHCKHLYDTGLQQMRYKESQYKENITNKSNEYLQFDYKPKLNNTYHIPHSTSQLDFYNQQTQWQNKLNTNNMNYKTQLDNKQNLNCTFTPCINKTTMKTDEEFIEKHLDQINKYVMRRRRSIEKENEKRMYYKKRLGNIDSNGSYNHSYSNSNSNSYSNNHSNSYSNNSNSYCNSHSHTKKEGRKIALRKENKRVYYSAMHSPSRSPIKTENEIKYMQKISKM